MHSAATELAWRCYRALLQSILVELRQSSLVELQQSVLVGGIAGTPTKLAGDTAAEHVAGSATEHAIQHLLTFCSGNAEPC